MLMKSAVFAGLLLSVFGAGCDIDDEHESSRVVEIVDEDAEQELEPEPEFDLSDVSKSTAGSGGIGPQPKRCCVSCNGDNWTGWWDLGTGNSPTCNTRGPKWCHDHNWNFGNAEWFKTCPAG